MNIRPFLLLLVAVSTFTAVSSASAQATRTWISGVGDDANPCSRTAPCKTWAGAISKTAAGGEINALDAGPFGPVTIGKAMTLDGNGSFAGISATINNGILVNAGANDVVIVRNVHITGNGSAVSGIRFNSGKALHVEESTIRGFTSFGLDFRPSAGANLFVHNTTVRNNAGGGVYVAPGAGIVAGANLEKVSLENNLFGLRADDGARVTVHDSVATENSANGFVLAGNSAAVELNLDDCVSTNNEQVGVKSVGAGATVRLSNTAVTNNGTGLQALNGGSIVSFGNNRIAGNITDGAPTSNQPRQ